MAVLVAEQPQADHLLGLRGRVGRVLRVQGGGQARLDRELVDHDVSRAAVGVDFGLAVTPLLYRPGDERFAEAELGITVAAEHRPEVALRAGFAAFGARLGMNDEHTVY